jgi:hypothetical protein
MHRNSLSLFCILLLAASACSLPDKGPSISPATDDGLDYQPILPEEIPTGAYDIGSPELTDIYVSPDGDDGNDGLSAASPLRTLSVAWERLPVLPALSITGYRINLLPGTFPCEPEEPDNCQNYYSGRHGTVEFPIILQAYAGPGTVIIRGGFDIRDVSYLYLIDLTLVGGTPLPTNQSGNNLLHLAAVDHVLLRGMALIGPDCDNDSCNNLQEVLKINQAQYIFVESSLVSGAWHSAVDYFSVQGGHFLNNEVHTAGQWCMYVKGGSAYLRIEGNEFHDCQLGFQAGQSSNLPVMTSPWLHYEVYDIKFVNNILHDIPGVGLSVSGGYNVLFAYNTLYKVGTTTDPGYPLIQLVHGERGCSPTDEIPDPVRICEGLLAAGGWGPGFMTDNLPAIPNRNVFILNNLFYNPSGQTLYTNLYIAPPLELPSGFQYLPDPVPADDNLVIAGNLIWNGPADHPLGVDEGSGCGEGNPTCNPEQLLRDNTINTLEPQLVDPENGDFRPLPGGNLFTVLIFPLPDFSWDEFTPSVPAGEPSNAVAIDRLGNPRTVSDPPGAYAGV